MQSTLTAVETTGTISGARRLELDEDLPDAVAAKVRVIVLYAPTDDFDEREWLRAAARNPAFDFLDDAAENIYTLEDGKPFADET